MEMEVLPGSGREALEIKAKGGEQKKSGTPAAEPPVSKLPSL